MEFASAWSQIHLKFKFLTIRTMTAVGKIHSNGFSKTCLDFIYINTIS